MNSIKKPGFGYSYLIGKASLSLGRHSGKEIGDSIRSPYRGDSVDIASLCELLAEKEGGSVGA